jgi:two-component system sensor histidine kinase DesK
MPTTELILKKRDRNWAWVWVAYSAFVFIQPYFEPTPGLWRKTLIALAIFLVIFSTYIRSTEKGSALRYWMIGAMFLLGLTCFPFNRGCSTFFVYTASFLPFTVESTSLVFTLFGVESVLILLERQIFHLDWPNTLIAVLLTLVIGIGNIFAAQQRRAACKLRAAQEENIALAAVAERERIARDLHDVLGHTLSVIVLKAELAGRLLSHPDNPNPARAAAEIADVERTARTALADVREAIGGYRARGLAAEIEAARRTLDAAGVTLTLDSEPSAAASLSANEETVLSLALREAVTNIVRHSRATTCRLRFIHQDGRRRLVVQDNGHNPNLREGNGLRGMRQRVESLGGNLLLEIVPDPAQPAEQPAHGTRLSIDLPLHPESA